MDGWQSGFGGLMADEYDDGEVVIVGEIKFFFIFVLSCWFLQKTIYFGLFWFGRRLSKNKKLQMTT